MDDTPGPPAGARATGLVRALAIVNFIFAGLLLACGVGGSAMSMRGASAENVESALAVVGADSEMGERVRRAAAAQKAFGAIIFALSLLCLAAALVSGVHLMKMRKLGWRLGVASAALSGVLAVTSFTFVLPGGIGALIVYGGYAGFAAFVLTGGSRRGRFS